MTHISKKTLWLVIILLLLSLTGAFLIAYATRGGIGVVSDSVSYITYARNLVAGRGFGHIYPSGRFVFVSRWAPLYPLTLAFFNAVHLDMMEAARYLNCVLFSCFIFLNGWLIYRILNSIFLSILTASLATFSPLSIQLFVYAMSEPFFYVFSIISLLCLLCYLKSNKNLYFYLSAISCGFALVDRYAAFPLIIVNCMIIMIYGYKGLLLTSKKILLYGVTSSILLVIWIAIVWFNTRTIGGRTDELLIDQRILTREYIHWLILSFSQWLPNSDSISWLIPRDLYKNLIQLVICALFAVTVSLLLLKYRKDILKVPGVNLAVYACLYIGAYVILLFMVHSFSDLSGLNRRNFSLIEYYSWLAIISFAFLIMYKISNRHYLAYIVMVALVFAGCFNLQKGLAKVMAYPAGGFGYYKEANRNSELIKAVGQLPESTQLISNEALMVLLFTSRFPYNIMEIERGKPLLSFVPFGSDTADPAQKAFVENQAALVLFDSDYNQFYQIYGNQASERIKKLTEGLYLFICKADGAIYFYQQPDFVK